MAPPAFEPLPLGTILDGRYRLKDLIGEGGMGRVYHGEDMRLGRQVAIKLLHEEANGDDTMAERLFREAKAAARAEHPAVITMYGYGVDPDFGISYVVMERLQGEDLAQRITRLGPLPSALVSRVALETADALTAVHDSGVVHRDLKPSNIFLASRGVRVDDVKLLDFGVAKQLDLHTLTTTGQVYGTPMYMAPEQLADSKRVDARCDVYSLGAVLFECLTGHAPFSAPHITSLISQIMFGPQPDIRAARADVPEILAEVVTRCMQKSPADRFSDARDICALLSGG